MTRKSRRRVLWVDALCINQSDEQERSHQIALMADIYRKASKVLIWLENVVEPPAMLDKCSNIFAINNSDFHDIMKRDKKIIPSLVTDQVLMDHGNWLLAFCQAEYWSRLWILQEVVLASQLALYIDGKPAQWTPHNDAFSFMQQVHFRSLDDPRRFAVIRNSVPARLSELWRGHYVEKNAAWGTRPTRPKEYSLLQLILTYEVAKCKEKHDKVFGLLGMAMACCQNAIGVEYSQTTLLLCQQLILHEYFEQIPHGLDPTDTMTVCFKLHEICDAKYSEHELFSPRALKKRPEENRERITIRKTLQEARILRVFQLELDPSGRTSNFILKKGEKSTEEMRVGPAPSISYARDQRVRSSQASYDRNLQT